VTPVTLAAQPGTSQQAAVEAALLVLERMGLSPADLQAARLLASGGKVAAGEPFRTPGGREAR
jgi:hypothetical protein